MIDQFFKPIYPCLMLLPVLAFLCLWCLRVLSEREDWRVGFLKAALWWATATLLVTELLSAFSASVPQRSSWHGFLSLRPRGMSSGATLLKMETGLLLSQRGSLRFLLKAGGSSRVFLRS
ncbi:MAG: hypothetical protein IT391_01435 [Nitrospira sp.]|nr:hypothetical protein [Nitrospira sp.]